MDHSKLVIVVLVVLAVLYIGSIGLGIKNNGTPSENIDPGQIEQFMTQHPRTRSVMRGLEGLLGGFAPALESSDLTPEGSTLSPPSGKDTLTISIRSSEDKIRFVRLYLATGNRARITYHPTLPNTMNNADKQSVTLFRRPIAHQPVARPTGPTNMTGPRATGHPNLSGRRVAGSLAAQPLTKLRDELMIYDVGGTLQLVCNGCQVRLE